MKIMTVFLLCLLMAAGGVMKPETDEYKGREFRGVAQFADWTTETAGSASVWTSPFYPVNIAADEIVVSWNAVTPTGTGITVAVRADKGDGQFTRWYVMGKWSQDGKSFPRESVEGQKDADGNVATDTLVRNACKFGSRSTAQTANCRR
jgi:hypothetical protein